MKKIILYSLYDLTRSRWTYVYCGFYLLLTLILLALTPDFSKVIISLMNVVLILAPLIAAMVGVMYYYNSREFTELLLAQPLPRGRIFLGHYLGLAVSLSLSLALGLAVPFLLFGVLASAALGQFLILVGVGVFLCFIFSAIAYLIAMQNENRIKGFGMAILAWLLFAIVYDGLFLLLLAAFSDYPLERFAVAATLFNPIDLSRVLILLKLDISALMGYTGAVFHHFFGNGLGMAISLAWLSAWVLGPVWGIRRTALRKDF